MVWARVSEWRVRGPGDSLNLKFLSPIARPFFFLGLELVVQNAGYSPKHGVAHAARSFSFFVTSPSSPSILLQLPAKEIGGLGRVAQPLRQNYEFELDRL